MDITPEDDADTARHTHSTPLCAARLSLLAAKSKLLIELRELSSLSGILYPSFTFDHETRSQRARST